MDRRVKKGFSLRTKWAAIMSVFVLITFILFAVIFYKNIEDLIVNEERTRIESIMKDLTSRLSKSTTDLTSEDVTKIFSEVQPLDSQHIHKNDFLVSDLSQREVYIYIFDKEQNLLFQTHPYQKLMYDKPLTVKLSFKKVKGLYGYVYGKKIISDKTGRPIGYIQIFYEMNNLYKLRKEILNNLIIFMFVWIALVVCFEFFVSKLYIAPLKKLTHIIEDIKEHPMTDQRADLPIFHDELWKLTNLFNGMLDHMQRYIEQQRQFVDDVSHELRTPVTIIEGHLNLLERWGKDDPEVLDESLKASVQEIERMKILIQEMLDLSRLDQSKIKHYNETSRAREVIMQVVNNFQMIHPNFTFIVDDDLKHEIEVVIYRNHLEQLLIILLDNAVKYSNKEDKKIIHISIASNPYHLEIGIQDYGEGISKDDIDRIFDRFYRVDKARSREKGGNGLGLSIAQKLIYIYNGHLNVESSLGQGTLFKIELPIAPKSDD